MFTSRAEFRLHFRIDNADERLTPLGRRLGLVSDGRWQQFEHKQSQKKAITKLLSAKRTSAVPMLAHVAADNPPLAVWLRRPESNMSQIASWLASQLLEEPVDAVLATVETEIKYAGYMAQQERQIQQLAEADGRVIPADFVYTSIPGLSSEVQQKLSRVQPATLGQAKRIPGVTPAAISVLDVYLKLVPRETFVERV
jgi:tRNA uridine 5-carboxymethylaminomethyl modification enzyme